MKRIFSIIFIFTLFFSLSACNSKNCKKIRIGVIDSYISDEIQSEYNVIAMNNILGKKTYNNITHGSMILSIILENVSNCEIFYCSIYDDNCIGQIDDVAQAITWCVDNNVDIITMSFATLSDHKEIRESIERAINNHIIITASCINLSDKTCYPAMYDGVISVSDGFNKMATVILKGKKVKFKIDGNLMEKREVSFLAPYICGKIANELSNGKTIENILKESNFK